MENRKELIKSLENLRNSKIICYFTGDRRNQETQIGDDVLPFFSQHLSKIGKVPKIDLLLYSRGGNTLTGFALANALREFAGSINVMIPFRAHSCATLIALSADSVIMGPFGQLSPIDPTITTPHGPTIGEANEMKFLPVSVEDVANYFELARKEAGLKDENNMATVLSHLCNRVSPLALGAVYRAREQIGMLATKLLNLHMNDKERIERIVRSLTRELLSHDYVIGRREGKTIGLQVVDATEEEDKIMWHIYEDISKELKLSEPWNWESEAARPNQETLSITKALLESYELKHKFVSTYKIKRIHSSQSGRKTEELQITLLDEGWKIE